MSNAVRRKYYNILQTQLRASKVDVEELPACVVDILYNRTYHAGSLTNAMVEAVRNKEYNKFADVVRKFNPNFAKRLEREAKHIEDGLKSKM